MSSLLFLTSEDFGVAASEQGNVLRHDISGISLVLFYSTQCIYCQRIIPIFKRLPDVVSGCHFGMVNISMNRALIEMAKSTITPITYVPLLILYVNGKPYVKYDGPPTESDIREFVSTVSKQAYSTDFARQSRTRNEIPSYTLGHPLVGQTEVCYLEFSERDGYHASN
jgi:thiol-disulfide isomerase/thioredoxin